MKPLNRNNLFLKKGDPAPVRCMMNVDFFPAPGAVTECFRPDVPTAGEYGAVPVASRDRVTGNCNRATKKLSGAG